MQKKEKTTTDGRKKIPCRKLLNFSRGGDIVREAWKIRVNIVFWDVAC